MTALDVAVVQGDCKAQDALLERGGKVYLAVLQLLRKVFMQIGVTLLPSNPPYVQQTVICPPSGFPCGSGWRSSGRRWLYLGRKDRASLLYRLPLDIIRVIDRMLLCSSSDTSWCQAAARCGAKDKRAARSVVLAQCNKVLSEAYNRILPLSVQPVLLHAGDMDLCATLRPQSGLSLPLPPGPR
jgi:hypothetical protein